MFMALPNIHPLIIDEITVLISGGFMECFNADEQAVIGTFLATLGSMISLNSVLILYQQGQNQIVDQDDDNQDSKDEDKQKDNQTYELLEKSINKIKEEIEKIKNDQK